MRWKAWALQAMEEGKGRCICSREAPTAPSLRPELGWREHPGKALSLEAQDKAWATLEAMT